MADILGADGAFDRRPELTRPRRVVYQQPTPPASSEFGRLRLAESPQAPDPLARTQPAPQARPVSSQPTSMTVVSNVPRIPAPNRMQTADLIGVRSEALDALRSEQLKLRAMTMVPRTERDQMAINQQAALIRDLRRQGASADRLLRDQRRAQLTPEEIAKSQQALAGQYEQIREGRLLRARQAEERAASEVNRIRASGGAMGGLERSQSDLQNAMRERQTAESLPQTLTFETATPEELARTQQVRAQRVAADELAVQGALASREQTGSTLPQSVQAARADAEAIRRAEQQRLVQEASGRPPVSPLEEAQVGLVGAQAESVRAQAGLATAEADRLRRTPVVSPAEAVAAERGMLENTLLGEQVADVQNGATTRRVMQRLEQSQAQDQTVIQFNPAIPGISERLATTISQFSGKVTSMDNNQRRQFNGAVEAFRALPGEQKRVAARLIYQTLAQSGSFEFLTSVSSDNRQTYLSQLDAWAMRVFGKDSRENQQAWQRTFREVATEAQRLATQE